MGGPDPAAGPGGRRHPQRPRDRGSCCARCARAPGAPRRRRRTAGRRRRRAPRAAERHAPARALAAAQRLDAAGAGEARVAGVQARVARQAVGDRRARSAARPSLRTVSVTAIVPPAAAVGGGRQGADREVRRRLARPRERAPGRLPGPLIRRARRSRRPALRRIGDRTRSFGSDPTPRAPMRESKRPSPSRAALGLVLAGAGLLAAHDLALGVHARGDGLVGRS